LGSAPNAYPPHASTERAAPLAEEASSAPSSSSTPKPASSPQDATYAPQETLHIPAAETAPAEEMISSQATEAPQETLPPSNIEATSVETTTKSAKTTTKECPASQPVEATPPESNQTNSMASGSSFYGLYPLWESTGNMLGHRRVFIGTNWLALGFAQRFSIGIRPVSFFFRVPNADFKALVFERNNLKVSMQLAPSLILPGASESFTSTNFVSRFDDANHHLWLLPLSANASWHILDELCLHASLTALGTLGKHVPNLQVTFGLAVFAEFMAWKNHSFMLHLGEIGFWNHDLSIVGASYRFHWKWLEAQLGYFYRFSPDGNQGGPLIALGVLL
jgi:hypothetical protein